MHREKDNLSIAMLWFIILMFMGCSGPDRTLYERGKNAFDSGQFDLANSMLTRLVKEFPTSPYSEEALFLLAEISDSYIKNPERAIEYYTQLMYLHPSGQFACPARFNLADIYRSSFAELDKAIEEYQKVMVQCADLDIKARAQKNIGDCYFDSGNYSQAVIEYQIVDRDFPGSTDHLLVLKRIADCHYIQGNMELAEIFYRKFLKQYPDSALSEEVQATLAQVLVNESQYCLAQEVLQTLNTKIPDRSDISVMLEKVTRQCQDSRVQQNKSVLE